MGHSINALEAQTLGELLTEAITFRRHLDFGGLSLDMTVQSLFNFGSCLKLSLLSSAILLAISPGFAQTKVGYHPNKVQPSEDVTIGERIALETEQKFTVLRNEEVVSYLSEVGNRLVRAIQ